MAKFVLFSDGPCWKLNCWEVKVGPHVNVKQVPEELSKNKPKDFLFCDSTIWKNNHKEVEVSKRVTYTGH